MLNNSNRLLIDTVRLQMRNLKIDDLADFYAYRFAMLKKNGYYRTYKFS